MACAPPFGETQFLRLPCSREPLWFGVLLTPGRSQSHTFHFRPALVPRASLPSYVFPTDVCPGTLCPFGAARRNDTCITWREEPNRKR